MDTTAQIESLKIRSVTGRDARVIIRCTEFDGETQTIKLFDPEAAKALAKHLIDWAESCQ